MRTSKERGESASSRMKNYFSTVGRRVVGIIWTGIKMLFPIYILLWVFFGFAPKGLLYFALGMALYMGVRIAFNFKQYVNILRYGEMQVFGKPLDRIYWKDERPRMPKVVWRKKKQDEKGTDESSTQ